MKTRTKGLIGLLALFVIVIAVFVIIFVVNGATEMTATDFYDKLYSGKIEASETNPLSISNDTWTFRSGSKSYFVYLYNTSNSDQDRLDNYNALVQYASFLDGQVADAAITADEANGLWQLKINDTFDKYHYHIEEGYENFKSFKIIHYKESNRYTVSILDFAYPIAMIAFMVIFLIYIFRAFKSGGNVASDFGKSKTSVQSQLKVRFSDVAGAEEEKEELKEIVDFLKAPQKFMSVGARIPKGVLLVGPPGTGKTLFAKAVAGEANVPFFSISGSDFVEMFVGVGASRVRDLFAQAKKSQPCIIFIDEIDAVGRQRGAGLGGGHDEREQTLNQLLVQMDGFETSEAIIVMAATNRADILDPALLRPGRFDRRIFVHVPDVRGREAIFKVHARNKPMSPDIDFQRLARMTSGFTGAEIENLLNESAILCARANRKEIIMEDIFEGIDKVVMGPQKKSRLVTEVDKRITAYHEGGHAIVAYKLQPYCDPVHEISIIPRGQAAGYTMMRPDNDDEHLTYKRLTSNIAMTLGGRAAEEIVIKDISAGASGDIKQATEMARKMVTEWGMSSSVGPIYYGGSQEVFLGRDYGSSHTYSEETAAAIDAEVHRLLAEGRETALNIIQENRSILDVLVRVLIEKETIYQEEFEMIMNGKSAEDVMNTIDERTFRNFGNKN